jgi:hypothetical protein
LDGVLPASLAPTEALAPLPVARGLASVRTVAVPLALAAVYVVLLIVRFPQLIGWLNGDADYASAYVLPELIAHGHTGGVMMSTQGAWASLWFGLATAWLSFHRVLWEIAPALIALLSALVVGWATARVATRAAGVLAVALIVAASPVGIANFAAPWAHNTTLLGVALLVAFLVWLYGAQRRPVAIAAAAAALSLIVGIFAASDSLLLTEGLIPFVAAPLLLAITGSDRRGLLPVWSVAAGATVMSGITSSVMRSLGYRTTSPPLHFAGSQVGVHIRWLAQGLLHMGNGLTVAPESSWRTPLTIAAAVVTICAVGAATWLAARHARHPGVGQMRARSVFVTFWAASVICAATAYVLLVEVPSDQYFLVAIPAVAATVPLLAGSRRANRLIAAGATVFIAASIVALAAGDSRHVNHLAMNPSDTSRIEAVVQSHRLGIGYASYWEAAPLDWFSHGRLQIHPIEEIDYQTQPMVGPRIDAWYRVHPHTPSYVLLAPDDNLLPDHVPSDLPAPQRLIKVGKFTLATYSYDIAAYLHRPVAG